MSYLIAIDTLTGRKPTSRTLYPTVQAATAEADRLNATQFGTFTALDADHEPGRTLIRTRSGF